MNSTVAEVELKYEAILGESPLWDEREDLLYWVDIISGILFEYDPVARENNSYQMDNSLGAIALREKPGLVMATGSGFSIFQKEEKQLTTIVDPEEHLPDNRFNDGKCDPAGRFWAGTLSNKLESGAGNLYCLNQDQSIDLKLQDLTISNGMCWSKSHGFFFFIDSPTRKIMRYDYSKVSGEIAAPSVVTKIEDSEGLPDGMTIDEEGKLWVALYNGAKVIRIDPADGEILHEVIVPVPKVTSCTFGGAQLDELFITTARENMDSEELEDYPLSGSLFKVKLPVRGLPSFRFKG